MIGFREGYKECPGLVLHLEYRYVVCCEKRGRDLCCHVVQLIRALSGEEKRERERESEGERERERERVREWEIE